MLYNPVRHEPLIPTAWNEAEVRREIEAIAADTAAARQAHAWWPEHPRDDFEPHPIPSKTLYLGAAGVYWALDHLAAKGLSSVAVTTPQIWQDIADSYVSQPDTGKDVPSWFLGSSFPMLLGMLRGPKHARAAAGAALYEAVGSNIANPTWEVLWGSPGTMLAALFAYEATGEERWRGAYQRNAERLWDEWRFDEALDCHIWTQDLYGHRGILYGAGHGFVGNAFALLRGCALLPEGLVDLIHARVATTTKRLAVKENGHANWPVGPGKSFLLQWCHGAPGFLLSVAKDLPSGKDDELDQLLAAAGHLIWKAGPLTKGACFCHGTDGNGMAMLALFERTGDELWLERSRAFAMHAMRQSRDNLARFGRRRYTLWSGDLGLAVYLGACLEGRAFSPAWDGI